MEDVSDAEAVALCNLTDALENEGELAGWDRAVHADVIGDPAHGTEGGFASLPDRCAFCLRLRYVQALGIERLGNLDNAAEHILDLGIRALNLDDQHRLDIERVAGLGKAFTDLNGGGGPLCPSDRGRARPPAGLWST